MIEPWSKFFWSDYDADEGLRMCSLAAQGLWMRMLCLMARATPKGELRVGGEPCTVSDLSRAVGETEETVAGLLGELRRRGVYSTTRADVIFSRRMRKDAEISRKRAKSGAVGAAVRYGKQADNQACNGKTPAKPLAKASLQKPEARKKNPSGKKECRIPDGWRPEPFASGQAKAIVDSWSADEFERQVETFVAHHVGHETEWSDWQRAWQTWVLNSVKFAARPSKQDPDNRFAYMEHLKRELAQRPKAAGGRA
jgi:hypothetical protein